MPQYFWQSAEWPHFRWDSAQLLSPLGRARKKQEDVVSIYKAIVENETGRHVFIEGKVEDRSAFCVEIVF